MQTPEGLPTYNTNSGGGCQRFPQIPDPPELRLSSGV